jgi:nicotinamidase-related amidase
MTSAMTSTLPSNQTIGRSAVVLLNLQNEVVDPKGVIGGHGAAARVAEREVLRNAAAVLAHARDKGIPVIACGVRYRPGHPEVDRRVPLFNMIVQGGALVEGSWGAQFAEEVAPTGSDLTVWHQGFSGYCGGDLDLVLSTLGVDTVVLGGVATRMVVEATARDSAETGRAVVVLEDCCASATEQADAAALATLKMIGQVTDSREWITGASARN